MAKQLPLCILIEGQRSVEPWPSLTNATNLMILTPELIFAGTGFHRHSTERSQNDKEQKRRE
jgi:hypothetical protein